MVLALSDFKIDRNAIKRMTKDIEREFARNPVRIPLETSSPGSLSDESTHARWSAVTTTAACILDWLHASPQSSDSSVRSPRWRLTSTIIPCSACSSRTAALQLAVLLPRISSRSLIAGVVATNMFGSC